MGRWNKQYDTTTALILMGARPYDPNTGRFLAVDPIPGGSLNNYDYAGQDPINGYDLNGMCLGIPFSGPCPWDGVVHDAVNAVAFVVYAPYYAIHWAARKTHDLVFLLGFPNLFIIEGESLGGDMGLDWLKKQWGWEHSVCDEGPGQHLSPFHGRGKGHAFLPGCRVVHGHWHLDYP